MTLPECWNVLIFSQAKRLSSVAEAFMKHEVVPDSIDVAPEKKAELVYDSGVEVGALFIGCGGGW